MHAQRTSCVYARVYARVRARVRAQLCVRAQLSVYARVCVLSSACMRVCARYYSMLSVAQGGPLAHARPLCVCI